MMENRAYRSARSSATKTIRRFLAVLLAGGMLFSLCACAGEKSVEIEPVTVEREPGPEALQTANAATALALRYYIYARLKTEAFIAADFQSIPAQELKELVDELVLVWETADMLASGAQEIANQALVVLDGSLVQQTALGQSGMRLTTLSAKPSNIRPVLLAAGEAKEIDPKTWAKRARSAGRRRSRQKRIESSMP